MATFTVLVVGGSGFLGQHLVGLLQTRAPFVTNIRVLDVVPYTNLLGHSERVHVEVFTGSVNDEHLVRRACTGATYIVHMATVIDISMFPDVEKTKKINVDGVRTVLGVASDMECVKGFIYSSSVTIYMGPGSSGTSLTEASPLPNAYYFEPYASAKVEAERLVVAANGPSLKTVIIRPAVMYGELDHACVPQMSAAANMRGYMLNMKANNSTHQYAYAGNVAWGFVCALKTLDEQFVQRRSSSAITGSPKAKMCDISGQAFIIQDDTEPVHTLVKEKYYLEDAGIRYVRVKIPAFVLMWILYVVTFIFKILSVVGLKLNCPYTASSMNFLYHNYVFSDRKAREQLGYSPIYSSEEARRRSVVYYRKRWAEIKTGSKT